MSEVPSTPFDLSALDLRVKAATPVRMVPYHPAYESAAVKPPLPMVLLIVGTDSPDYEAVRHEVSQESLRRLRLGHDDFLTKEEALENTVRMIGACVKGWEGVVVDGEPLEFNPTNVRKVLLRFGWLRDQISDFANNRKHYLGN